MTEAKSKKRPPTHPMIREVVALLPLPPQSNFSPAERKAWLRLMDNTLQVVFPMSVDELEHPEPSAPPPMPAAEKVSVRQASEHLLHDFYVDKQGHVRKSDGTPAMPSEVGDEVIYDMRTGEQRDKDFIVWADGSMGAQPGMSFGGPG